jgi:hypothetical protein
MNRRSFIKGVASASAAVAVAGCFEPNTLNCDDYIEVEHEVDGGVVTVEADVWKEDAHIPDTYVDVAFTLTVDGEEYTATRTDVFIDAYVNEHQTGKALAVTFNIDEDYTTLSSDVTIADTRRANP